MEPAARLGRLQTRRLTGRWEQRQEVAQVYTQIRVRIKMQIDSAETRGFDGSDARGICVDIGWSCSKGINLGKNGGIISDIFDFIYKCGGNKTILHMAIK